MCKPTMTSGVKLAILEQAQALLIHPSDLIVMIEQADWPYVRVLIYDQNDYLHGSSTRDIKYKNFGNIAYGTEYKFDQFKVIKGGKSGMYR